MESNSSCDIKIVVNSLSTELHEPSHNSDVFPPELANCNDKSWQFCGLINKLKTTILVIVWLLCCFALLANNVKIPENHQIIIPKGKMQDYLIWEKLNGNELEVTLKGALIPKYYKNLTTNWLEVWIEMIYIEKLLNFYTSDTKIFRNITNIWSIPLVYEDLIGHVPEVSYTKIFQLNLKNTDDDDIKCLSIKFRTNIEKNLPILMNYNLEPINTDNGIIYAVLILVGLYVLIIFELLHRTLAAVLASTVSIAVLTWLNAKPTISEIVSWIDIETLLLLFSMMILVTILSETGIFDYLSVFTYKITNGRIWALITTLCLLTTILSCFLDTVTTTLLITPVTIKLCEVMKLNPVPVLMYMLIFGNIGGAITPVGDPPNVIIANNPEVIKSGVNFGTFTLHMGTGTVIVLITIYFQLRCTHRNVNFFKVTEPRKVQELRREIAVWQRVAASVSSYIKEEEHVKESIIKHSTTLKDRLKTVDNRVIIADDHNQHVKRLQEKYPIKDKVLLIKSGCTLFLVICVFFLHSLPIMSRLGLGWTAFLGALLLLVLYDKDNIECILTRIEWSTLLFFASLFILMEALSKLGLIEWICKQTQYLIQSIDKEYRLTLAIILILWISAIISAFVDNLPLTTMMMRVAIDLSKNQDLNLPLQPLIWALSFGACYGGNGSLLGSSSNIICAGVVEQHGYRFTFLEFTRIGLPVMFSSMVIITIYLFICHIVLSWHS